MRLRWKKTPKPSGLRAMTTPRSSTYTDGTTKYATVQQQYRPTVGWFWHGRVGAAFANTSEVPVADEATAKQQAQEWVKAQLATRSDAGEQRG